jgi:integrase
MAFVTDKEELKPGLVIFRRADVQHRNWYCRVKLPKADRYKTVSLKTSDRESARERAFDQDADVRFRILHDVPVFNRPFRDVAKEFIAEQKKRAARGEVSKARPEKMQSIIDGALDDYVGTTQVHLIGQESWENYPGWRRSNGQGRYARNGTRDATEAEIAAAAQAAVEKEAKAKLKAEIASRRRRRRGAVDVAKPEDTVIADGGDKPKPLTTVSVISDSTIRFEMSIFGAVMNYAAKKRYVTASQKFDGKPKLKTMRRDEFTLEEYRKLHTKGRVWMGEAAEGSASRWARTVAYNFILIMCNTGMRPSEAKNLRWRDITYAKDREGREIVVLFVQGKGKSRSLVAPASVIKYLNRVSEIAKAKGPDDRVFTISTGAPAKTLYTNMIEALLKRAGLRFGPHGVPRSTYCFRHTCTSSEVLRQVGSGFSGELASSGVEI